MELGILSIAWALWFAFRFFSHLKEESKAIPAYWGVVSIIYAVFGVLVLVGVI